MHGGKPMNNMLKKKKKLKERSEISGVNDWVSTDDFITADIEGDGGLDASIGFETTRDENIGPAFNDSLTRFSYYFNQKVSSKSSFGPSAPEAAL